MKSKVMDRIISKARRFRPSRLRPSIAKGAWVYAWLEGGFCKIGTTRDPIARARFYVIHTRPSGFLGPFYFALLCRGGKRTEQTILRKFKDHICFRKEWMKADPRLLEFVDSNTCAVWKIELGWRPRGKFDKQRSRIQLLIKQGLTGRQIGRTLGLSSSDTNHLYQWFGKKGLAWPVSPFGPASKLEAYKQDILKLRKEGLEPSQIVESLGIVKTQRERFRQSIVNWFCYLKKANKL